MMHYVYKSCIIYSLIVLLVSKEDFDCPCNNSDFCDCSSMGWDSIPTRLPGTVNGLNLSSNSIQTVRETDLKYYEKLKTLLLQFNKIHHINDDSFQSLERLEDLDLSYNNLSYLSSAWFRNLHMLNNLNLLGNKYLALGNQSLFASLSSLRTLQFGNPNFNIIQKKHFEALESLNKLEIYATHLTQYEVGSLKTIKYIDYVLLTVNIDSLPAMIRDLLYSVNVLEMKETQFMRPQDVEAFKLLDYTSARQLVLRNCVITDASVSRFLEIIKTYKNITDIILEDSELLGTGQGAPILGDEPSSVTTGIINKLHIPNFYLFSDLSGIYKIAPQFKKIVCTETKVFLIPCPFSRSFTSLEHLDISGNIISDTFLASSACFYEGGGAWPMLHTLNISRNLLSSLSMVGEVLSGQKYLTNLDLSQNKFGELTAPACKWPEKLKYLNISSCQMNNINSCIPSTLQILDVSSNFLTVFTIQISDLTELYISNNRLAKLPEGARLPSLVKLVVSGNKLNDFYQSELDLFEHLTMLDGRDNNYICSCQFLHFMHYHTITLLGWPDDYLCDSPSSVRHMRIQDAELPPLVCHKTLIVTLSCILLIAFVVIIVAVCHFLHVMWYIRMTWAWLKAKRKPLKSHDREICYDAFVSYSEQDFEWVENMMVPQLENSTPPLKLCLHKRDFVPGRWIIDNVIDAMETSYRTLFVLSEQFVKSEWCKYELEFSHFRLFDENNDTAILILLEPIEKETIPKRFFKLRKLMNTKTYLEWSTDEEHQQEFWCSLKAALQKEY